MKAFLAALAFVATVACGSAGSSGTGATSPSPSGNPVGFDVTLTERDHVGTMRAGQTVQLILHATPGNTDWASVQSSNALVLVPIPHPAATSVRGVTLLAFKALKPGTSDVTAVAGADCSPGTACPMYAILLKITITVTS